MKTLRSKIVIATVLIFISIQFFQINTRNPDIVPQNDFTNIYSPPQQIQTILRTACYDCHSNETDYPWYASVAPVSWWIKDHIEHARGHLNFSTWNDYSVSEANHALEEITEEVQEKAMPLKSYQIAHSEARLSDEERKLLVEWIRSLTSGQ